MKKRGFTLIELMVSIGLFAFVVSITTGAYLIMIGITRDAQARVTAVNTLSYALETMTRTIRSGTNYECAATSGGVCVSLRVTDRDGATVTFARGSVGSKGVITEQDGAAATTPLTDPTVDVTTLVFTGTGFGTVDNIQSNVIVNIKGTVATGPGRTQDFAVESSATMRGIDK